MGRRPEEEETHRLLIRFFTSFFPAAFARERFFDTLSFAGLQVKGVALNLLDDVFLLHLALETTQRVLEGLTLLKSYFRQLTTPPNSSPLDPIVIARFRRQVKGECQSFRINSGFACAMVRFVHHSFELENEFERKLNLARRVRAGSSR